MAEEGTAKHGITDAAEEVAPAPAAEEGTGKHGTSATAEEVAPAPAPAKEEGTEKHGTSGAAEEVAPAAAVHIVHVEQQEGEHQAHHLRTLASVLGSEEAAREALVYSYSHAASGFAAKLTPKQAEEIEKQPGVLLVQPDRVYQVQTGPSTCHQVCTDVL